MIEKKYFISTQEECESLLTKLNDHYNFPNNFTITYSVIQDIVDSSNKVLVLKSNVLHLLSELELSKVSDTSPEIDLEF